MRNVVTRFKVFAAAAALFLTGEARGAVDWQTDENAHSHHLTNLPASGGPTEPPRTQDVAPGACIPKSPGANTLPFICSVANTDYITPSYTLGGDLSGTPASANVIKLLETSGPTHLTIGAIANGALTKRFGSTFIGATAGTDFENALTFTSPLSRSTNTISISANGITNALIRPGAALSVMGVAGSSPANVADIAASGADQVLITNGAGTAVVWSNTVPSASVALAAGAFGYGSAGGVLTGDAANAHWDATNFRAGFRTSAPAYQLHLVDQAGAVDRGVALGMHVTAPADATAPMVNILRSRGTFAAPTTVTNTDYLGRLAWLAHDGTNYLQVAAVGAHVTNGATVATGSVPTDWFVRGSSTGNAAQLDPYAGAGATLAIRANSSNHVMLGLNALTADPGYTVSISNNLLVGNGGVANSTTFGFSGSQFINQSQVLLMSNTSNDSLTSSLRFARSNGTNAAPTTLASDDSMPAIRWYGFDGTGYVNSMANRVWVDHDTPVSTNVVAMEWSINPNAAGGAMSGLPALAVWHTYDVVVGDWSQWQDTHTSGFFRIVTGHTPPTLAPVPLHAPGGNATTATAMIYDDLHGRLYAYSPGTHWAPVAQDTTAMATGYMRNTTSTGVWSTTATIPYADITGAPAAITALTGDATATGPGSAALTLATVNASPGTYAYATVVVNGKGLVTTVTAGATPVLASRTLTPGTGISIDGGTSAVDLSANRTIAARFDNVSITATGGGALQRAAISGDGTIAAGANTFALTNIPSGTTMAGSLLATAIAAPSTPAAGKGSIYVDSTSKNLAVKDDAGVVKHGVQTAAAVSHQFATAINDAGAVSLAQPVEGDIVNLVTDLAGKQATGNYITALTGDATATGPGSVALTISANAVDNTKLANMATQTFKARTTAGTGDPEDLTGTQATAMLDVFTSTLKGLVPAGTGGAGTFLRFDGTWAVPPGAGGGGTVTDVGATLPLTSTHGATPTIALTYNGSLTLDGSNQLQVAAFTGDVTKPAGSNATTLVNIPSGTTMAGSLLATAIAAPSTPASGKGSIYVDSTSKNLAVKDDAGVVKHGVQTVAGVLHQFVTAISDAGVATLGQPATGDISGLATIASTGSANDLISGTVPAGRFPALTGDITTPGGSLATTLKNTGAGAGSCTYCSVTFDAQGRETTYSSGAAPEVPLTFSTGLTRSTNTVTANISTGVSGGQTIIGGTAASNDLTISSTSNGTKGRDIFGSTTGMIYNEATGHLALGVASPDASATAQFTNNTNGIASVYVSNNSAGGSAFSGFVAGQSSSASGTTPTIAMYMGGSSNSNPFYGANAGVLELYGGSVTGGNGDMIFSIVETSGGYLWKTGTTPTNRMGLSNVGVLTVNGLGTGLAKLTSGAFGTASASDVAAAITWPTADRVLVSSGTSTAPTSAAGFVYNTSSDVLALSNGSQFAQFNVGTSGATNYEAVVTDWSANVWRLRSVKGGTGTVRSMKIDANTATLTLAGSNVAVATLTGAGNKVVMADVSGNLTATTAATSATAVFDYSGPMISATDSEIPAGTTYVDPGTGGHRYMLGAARASCEVDLVGILNSFTGGGTWSLQFLKNGVNMLTFGPFASGDLVGPTQTTVSVSGAAGDFYSLNWTKSGTVNVSGGGLHFNATLLCQ